MPGLFWLYAPICFLSGIPQRAAGGFVHFMTFPQNQPHNFLNTKALVITRAEGVGFVIDCFITRFYIFLVDSISYTFGFSSASHMASEAVRRMTTHFSPISSTTLPRHHKTLVTLLLPSHLPNVDITIFCSSTSSTSSTT